MTRRLRHASAGPARGVGKWRGRGRAPAALLGSAGREGGCTSVRGRWFCCTVVARAGWAWPGCLEAAGEEGRLSRAAAARWGEGDVASTSALTDWLLAFFIFPPLPFKRS